MEAKEVKEDYYLSPSDFLQIFCPLIGVVFVLSIGILIDDKSIWTDKSGMLVFCADLFFMALATCLLVFFYKTNRKEKAKVENTNVVYIQ